ncbi:MAG TPA: O-methyltransferase [Candidatus Cybelea sp.]|nr:O-methyltransferase [Candidatus Cybelea sp.]
MAHPPPHPLLVELELHAHKDGVPIVSHEMGRFLSTVVTAMQANRILEVGTGYGYSTLWMALAQPPIGRIWTVEPEAKHTKIALSYFRRAGEDDYIELFDTPALELLENFPHRNLDVVFIAANTEEYERYLDLVIPMLKLSGLAIFNDCLQVRDFAERFLNHPALDATILPLGEGAGIGARRQ